MLEGEKLFYMEQQFVTYQGKRYMVFGIKGDFVTIGNGDYSHLGEDSITVKKEEVIFI